MPDQPNQPAPNDDAELPPGLASALRGMFDAAPAVPREIDAAVLGEARAGFDRRRRFALAVRWVGSAAAAAAAIVVVALVLHHNRPGTPVAVNTGSPIAGDVDGSGRVDMLDAFLLARRVGAHSAGDAKVADVNGDGVIDRRDVDAVAAIAVRLPGGGR